MNAFSVDEEELRADKGVKIPKKELNQLIAELFEYTNQFEEVEQKNEVNRENEIETVPVQEEPQTEAAVTVNVILFLKFNLCE